MRRELLLGAHAGLDLAAWRQGRVVTDLYAAPLPALTPELSVVMAQVTRSLPGQKAALVRWDGGEGYWSGVQTAQPGQKHLLQIIQPPMGNKLAQLTSDITLIGRYISYKPQSIGIKFEEKELNISAELISLLKARGGGWILHPSIAMATKDQCEHEVDWLIAQNVEGYGLELWQRALILAARAGLDAIWVDNAARGRVVERWLDAFAPDLLPLLRVDELPELEEILAEASATTLSLPQGGTVMIEPTAALTAVDVNTGSGDNPLQVNIQAARLIARQLRLRQTGGVIVVDFVNMRPAHRSRLLTALRTAVADDPAGVQVFGISKLGLVEMTRSRRAWPLHMLRLSAEGV